MLFCGLDVGGTQQLNVNKIVFMLWVFFNYLVPIIFCSCRLFLSFKLLAYLSVQEDKVL